jgi:hypothetical protein
VFLKLSMQLALTDATGTFYKTDQEFNSEMKCATGEWAQPSQSWGLQRRISDSLTSEADD